MDQTDRDTARESSLVGELLFGKLRVESVLGRGGMGTVYRVTHLGTQHQRALKVMNPQIRLHPEALARFLREATVSATLKSAHVVETLDSGQLEDGSLYVLMELLDGAPLNALIEAAPMKLPRIARLLEQACTALALAHDKGIVHRDIKPDNLFVVRNDDGTESVKILDFGIARFREQRDQLGELTAENAVLGTPLYMAPEQIGTANTADGRADIYALGVVLYEALSGRKPYSASSFAELVANIFEGTATPLEQTAPGLTPRAYEVVRKAMARKPEDRFQTASELANALHELQQPFGRAADPLALTLPSVFPTPGALPSGTPLASQLQATSETSAAQGRSRGRAIAWGLVAIAGAGIAAYGVHHLIMGTNVAAVPGVDAGPADAAIAGPVDAAAFGSEPSALLDLGAAEPDDAGTDARSFVPDGPQRPHHLRRDAGARHSDLALPNEIYPEHP